VTLFGPDGKPGCAPGCIFSGYCGDAKVDGVFGEQCDLGTDLNVGAYNGCGQTCLLGPRCGDKVIQADQGEECDDGGRVGGDGCSRDCKIEIIP
jgi:cysteine-rich repeat protein